MSSLYQCRCCLARPPDKDLKSPYTILGKTEVYADMLKECFEINLTLSTTDSGICEVCIARLRDASEFKHQVTQCQQDLLEVINSLEVKDEMVPIVKEELSEDEDHAYDIIGEELKQELSELDELVDEDDRKLADLLSFTIKKKAEKKKKRGMLADDADNTSPLKISLRTLTQMSQMKRILKPVKLTSKGTKHNDDNAKHRTNVTNIIKYSNCTPFSNKTLSGILCAYCKETYQDIQELKTHIQSKHEDEELINKKNDKNNLSIKMDITNLQCKVCKENVSNISALKKHLTKQHDVKLYPDCHDYILEFKLTASQILNCALCHSTYETFKMLLQHMNGHYRNYICDNCDLGFINKHRLRNHQRTHDVGSFKCTFCEKVFSTRVRLMSHEKYIHKSTARYTTNCPQCDQSFNSYYQRNRHMNKVHNTAAATYRCNICDKSFILKSKLTSHIKKVHLMERNHTCPECGQGFFIKQSLDEHMIKHNGERVFKCTVCLKAYARKKTLREHMRIHNNDRRFKCGVCSLAFVQKCSLKSHMLSNHGIALSEYENPKVCA